jgi:hypothetical protein
MVVAMLALFVALTGTAVATTSALITGKQIKNGSITGLDIKNKSVAIADLATKARGARGVRGPIGPPGPAGQQGPQGPAGAPNPNAANSDLLDGIDSTDFLRRPTGLAHLTIPATALVDSNSAGRENVAGAGGWCTKSGGDRLHAAVHLPQGATIVSYSTDYVDDPGSAGGNGSNWLTRMPLLGKGGTYSDIFTNPMTNTAVAGATGTVTDNTPATTNVVDNTKHAYTLIIAPVAGAAVCSVDIAYTIAPGGVGVSATNAVESAVASAP